MSAAADSVEPPLDDIMLSMDVVDTLRQDARVVEEELNDDKRRAELIERLREIYRGQGIDVPDHILEEGVRALEESRFVYDPPKASIEVRLARLYVTRWSWGRWVGGGLAAILAIWIGWQLFHVLPQARQAEEARIELTETLPEQINTLYSTIDAETDSEPALEQAAQLRDAGLAAAKAGERQAARDAGTDLRSLLEILRRAYEVTIVSRPGELSGLWRVPRVNPEGRNYYLVVEALNDDGKAIEQSIVNEENGARETVRKWAVRVSKRVFDAVQADKLDDGIIQNAVIGTKQRGEPEVRWRVDVSGGALTQW